MHSSPRSTQSNILNETIKELVAEEVDIRLKELIKKNEIITAKPFVVDFNDKRLIHVRPPVNSSDVVTLGSLPFTSNDKNRSLHFGSYRLLSVGDPQTPQDFVTVSYANKHYEPRKNIEGSKKKG